MIDTYQRSTIYETMLFDQKTITKQNPTLPQVTNLLKNSKDISSLICISRIISSISFFDDVCQKYFTSLIELFKEEMNSNKRRNIMIVNAFIAHFLKVFHNNFQTYNEKHKNVTKLFPNFLTIYMKLFQGAFDEMDTLGQYKEIENFMIVIIQAINLYPTIIRPFQKIIEEILRKVFHSYIKSNRVSVNMKVFYITHSLLFRLAPIVETKFNQSIELLLPNIKEVMEYFKARETTVEYKRNNKQVLIIDIPSLLQDNLIHAIRSMEILFNLLKELFYLVPYNKLIQVKYSSLLMFYYEIITICVQENNYSYSIQGLNKSSYDIFLIELLKITIDHIAFHIENYSPFMLAHYNIINKILNKILLNVTIIPKHPQLFKATLSLYNTFICKIPKYFPDIIDSIIFSFTFNHFPTFYLDYLEKNDKTVVKVDDTFFKLGNKKGKMSLIEKSHLSDYSKLSANFLLKEIKDIVILFLKIVMNYFQCQHFSLIDSNKALLTALIDLIILPPHAKYVFYLANEVKNAMLDLIESLAHYSNIEQIISKGRIAQFCLGFYENDNRIETNNFRLGRIIQELNFANSNNEKCRGSNLTGLVIDFNIKIAERLKEKSEVLLKQLIPETENKIINSNNNNSNDEEKGFIKNTNIEDKDKAFLQKKRGIVDEDKEDKDQRKGFTKSKKQINPQQINQVNITYNSDTNNIAFITSENIQLKNQLSKPINIQSTLPNPKQGNDIDEVEVPDLI